MQFLHPMLFGSALGRRRLLNDDLGDAVLPVRRALDAVSSLQATFQRALDQAGLD